MNKLKKMTKEQIDITISTLDAYYTHSSKVDGESFRFDDLGKAVGTHLDKLLNNINADPLTRVYLNNAALLAIDIRAYIPDSISLISSLLKKYPLYSVFKIFEHSAYEKPERIPATPYIERDICNEQSFEAIPCLDLEHILYVDSHLNSNGVADRSWDNIKGLFLYARKNDLVQCDYESPSIDANCMKVFGKSREFMSLILSENSSLLLAIEFIFSDKVGSDYKSLSKYLSIQSYFAAKILIEMYSNPVKFKKFICLDKRNQIAYLMATLEQNNEVSEELNREYLTALTKMGII